MFDYEETVCGFESSWSHLDNLHVYILEGKCLSHNEKGGVPKIIKMISVKKRILIEGFWVFERFNEAVVSI